MSVSNSLVRINTVDLKYNKSTKTLIGHSDILNIGTPKVIEVKSHITNRVVKFVVNTAKMIENEFFDGEECHYVAEDDVSAKYLVIVSY